MIANLIVIPLNGNNGLYNITWLLNLWQHHVYFWLHQIVCHEKTIMQQQ